MGPFSFHLPIQQPKYTLMHQAPTVVEHLSPNGPWFQFQWPHTRDISTEELIPVMLLQLLGAYWSKQHICFKSDNLAMVSNLNSKTLKDIHLCHLLRTMFSIQHNTVLLTQQSTFQGYSNPCTPTYPGAIAGPVT